MATSWDIKLGGRIFVARQGSVTGSGTQSVTFTVPDRQLWQINTVTSSNPDSASRACRVIILDPDNVVYGYINPPNSAGPDYTAGATGGKSTFNPLGMVYVPAGFKIQGQWASLGSSLTTTWNLTAIGYPIS